MYQSYYQIIKVYFLIFWLYYAHGNYSDSTFNIAEYAFPG